MFDLSNIFAIQSQVLEQFLSTSIRTNINELELAESYLVGNRLIKFLSIVLPTHREYFSQDPKLYALRQRSQEQLVELLQYLEEIAIVIDEFQYNKYILRDLTPEEENLVLGLTGGPKFMAGTQDVSTDSSRSTMSPPSSGSPMSRESKGERRTNVGETLSPSAAAALPETTDPLQERVAQVVQMTQAFSDTYESTTERNQETAPNLFLKQSLMEAAATGHKQPTIRPRVTSHGGTTRDSRTPQGTFQNGRSHNNVILSNNHHATPPSISESSDPSFNAMSSSSSEVDQKEMLDQKCHSATAKRTPTTETTPKESAWNSDSFFAEWNLDELEADDKAIASSYIDLLDDDMWKQNRDNHFSCNKVPKLQQPKSHPTRSQRARATAAMQYDELYTQCQAGPRYLKKVAFNGKAIEDKAKEHAPLPPPSDAGIEEPKFKTKIEDRMERASVVQQELDHLERRKRANQRRRKGRSEEHAPLNPTEDDENSIIERGQGGTINQNILHHFRGCVQCLLD